MFQPRVNEDENEDPASPEGSEMDESSFINSSYSSGTNTSSKRSSIVEAEIHEKSLLNEFKTPIKKRPRKE